MSQKTVEEMKEQLELIITDLGDDIDGYLIIAVAKQRYFSSCRTENDLSLLGAVESVKHQFLTVHHGDHRVV